MRLNTMAAEVEFKLKKCNDVIFRNGKPVLKTPDFYDEKVSVTDWKDVSNDELINDLKELDFVAMDWRKNKDFETELKNFLIKYGPITKNFLDNRSELTSEFEETSLKEIRKIIRWFRYFTVLTEEVIKKRKIRKYRDEWVRDLSPLNKDDIDFLPMVYKHLQFIKTKSSEKNYRVYENSKSKTIDTFKIENCIDKYDFAIFLPESGFYNDIETEIEEKKYKDIEDDEWYFLAVKSALAMIKIWIEEIKLDFNIDNFELKQGNITHNFTFKAKNLMEAIVVQYYLDNLSMIEYKECEYKSCDNLVPPNRQKFCSDECSTKHRKAKHDDNKGFNTSYYLPKLIKEELTIEELCDKKNVNRNDVKIAIKSYSPTSDKYKKLLAEYKNKRDWI